MSLRRALRSVSLVMTAVGATAGSVCAQSVPLRVRPGRVVGVFDEPAGAPIDDVTVTDLGNGLSAKTTATGTVSLFFVDTAGGLIEFRKIGYTPVLLPIANSDRDSTPLTILMRHVVAELAPVVTRARGNRGPADTVKLLEEHGFYQRRESEAAPSSAFLTQDKIAGLTTLIDASRLTGRPFCPTNLYVNGIRAKPELIRGIQPKYVLAIEMYRSTVEAPAEFGGDKRYRDCGATVIWTE